jgi:hypothetical protein
MEYLEGHEEIVNRIGREITGITSENSMKNVFCRLRDRGLIEPVPGRVGFSAAWRRPSYPAASPPQPDTPTLPGLEEPPPTSKSKRPIPQRPRKRF